MHYIFARSMNYSRKVLKKLYSDGLLDRGCLIMLPMTVFRWEVLKLLQVYLISGVKFDHFSNESSRTKFYIKDKYRYYKASF